MQRIRVITLFLVFILLFGCEKYNNHPAFVFREQRERSLKKSKTEKVDEALVKTNQVISEKEKQKIKGFVERRRWKMGSLENGILIEETTRGDGVKLKDNDAIAIKYKLFLIDGNMIYNSDKDGLKIINFSSPSSDIEVGLIHALKQLSLGSKSRVIIPSFYGWGLYGNGDKIPPHSTLIYELEVIEKKSL